MYINVHTYMLRADMLKVFPQIILFQTETHKQI